MNFDIQVKTGTSKRLLTEGKYCDRDIVVTGTGGYTEEDLQAKYDEGEQAEYDRFWDIFQNNGSRVNYECAFYTGGWTNENFKPKYDLAPTNAISMFEGCQITDIKQILLDCDVVLDTSGVTGTGAGYLFRTSTVTHVPYLDLSNASALTNMFQSCFGLQEVSMKVAGNATWTNTFHACGALADLTIDGAVGTSINLAATSVLSGTSVQSVIDHLIDLTGQTTQTLTLHADVKAALTDTQLATITGKNWSVA